MAYLSNSDISVGIKVQTGGFDTAEAAGAVTSWEWLKLMEPPQIQRGRKLTTLPKSPTGARGTAPAPLAGSRDGGTITLRMMLQSQPSDYDATTDTPGVVFGTDSPAVYMLYDGFFGQVHTGTYAAATEFSATGNDANTWEKASGSWALNSGGMYMRGPSATAVDAHGWISTQSTSTAELAMDAQDATVDLSGHVLFPTATMSMASGHAVTVHTMRVINNTDEDYIYIGCVPQRCLLTLDEGDVPVMEITYMFTNWAIEASAFATQPPTSAASGAAFSEVPALVGNNLCRAWIGGVAASDGAVTAADVTCGIEALSVEFTNNMENIRCHSAAQGITDRVLLDTEVLINANIALGDDWQSSTTDVDFDDWLEGPTGKSISLEVGNVPGKCFGLFVPSAYQQSQWQELVIGETLVGASTTWAPSNDYTADEDAEAGDTAVRIAFG